MLKAAIQHKVVVGQAIAYTHQRTQPLHIRAKHNRVHSNIHELRREPLSADFRLQQKLNPHLGLVLPLHLEWAGVVGNKNTAVR